MSRLVVLFAALAVPLLASFPNPEVPEVDAASATAAVACLTGCILVLRARRNK